MFYVYLSVPILHNSILYIFRTIEFHTPHMEASVLLLQIALVALCATGWNVHVPACWTFPSPLSYVGFPISYVPHLPLSWFSPSFWWILSSNSFLRKAV